MNTLAIVKSTLLAVTFCAASCAHAGSVEILGQTSGSAEIQKSVIGVWSTNQRISFSESGRYTMVLSDFGSTNKKFGDSFSYLGAMISSSADNIASINVGNEMNTGNTLLSFDVTKGEYWLSLFAITDSR